MESLTRGSLILALIVLTEYFAEYHFSLNEDQHMLNSSSPTKRSIETVQTLRWQHTDKPNMLVFDFGELGVLKQDVIQLVKSNLPSKTRYTLFKYANSDYLVSVCFDDDVQNSLAENSQLTIRHKQLKSILKYRGLYIKQCNVYLQPTVGLCSANDAINFWRFEVLDLFDSAFDYNPLELKCQVAREITFALGKNVPERALLIHSRDIGLSKRKNGSVVLLLQEILLDKSRSQSLHDPIKKLIYIPFLKSYFPMVATKVTPYRTVYQDRIINHQ